MGGGTPSRAHRRDH